MTTDDGWPYDDGDRGGFEDRAMVTIDHVYGYGFYVNGAGQYAGPFKSQRAAEEWAWANSYRWVATKEGMEEWL